jgi:hypothetical protein
VTVRKNTLNESGMVIQVVLHTADKLNTLSGSAENVVLQCYVYNLTIRERTEHLPLALDFNLTSIANTSVLFHFSASLTSIGTTSGGKRGGKSGKTNAATRAVKIVRAPSM